MRKVSFKLPVFQSILEMLVFYHSENTGLVSRGYSEQIEKHSGWVHNSWANYHFDNPVILLKLRL